MRTFSAILLILLAVMTGGCSLAFASFVLPDFGAALRDGIGYIWLAGLLVAALCIWGAVRLFRRPDSRPLSATDQRHSLGQEEDR